MKNILKKYTTILHVLIIILIVFLEVFLITKNKYIFGYGGDWLIQSASFYEYFRSLFYETGNLFPNLALHIGGGQNIYYFVYYGLFSPCLLLFYMFPNASAGDYLMVINIINIIVSGILLYFFLLKNKFSQSLSLFGSLLLITSTSITFFSFTFIMFIQYIPFLIMGLFGTKKYLDTDKSLLLVISIILIITTSYYFSIPSIICLCLYALYYYIKINNKIIFKDIFREGLKYILRILFGIIITSFLLLPVIYTTFTGRSDVISDIYWKGLFSNINLNYLMYDSNGLGLSSVLWLAIIYNLFLKKENKMLSIFLLVLVGVPVFNLVLNGFLYKNGKVFIPFLPLFIILILNMFKNINSNNSKKTFLIFVISLLCSFIIIDFNSDIRMFIFCIDLLMTYVILNLYKNKKKNYIYIIVCLIFTISLYYIDYRDYKLEKEEYNKIYEIMNIDNSKYLYDGLNIYRTQYDMKNNCINYSDASYIYIPTLYSSSYNNLYSKIVYDIFNNNQENYNVLVMSAIKNIFFDKFMGIKYLYTNGDVPYGYEKIENFDNISLYKNENVYSLGFILSNLLNNDEYNKLSYIEKLLAYQNNIIIDGESINSNLDFNYDKISLDYDVIESKNITINKKDGHYIINSIGNGKLILSLDKSIKDKTLIIRFNVNNDSKKHISITINGINNTLSRNYYSYYNNNKTFDYVISSNEYINELNIFFSEGSYDISDIEIYTVDNTFFDENNTTPMVIDFDRTKGDHIYGNINVIEKGYFIFTIPYDKGYTVYVDNKEVEIEKVNGGFIGFKIEPGEHDIHLTFEAPYAKLGRLISLIGIIVLTVLVIFERKNKEKLFI